MSYSIKTTIMPACEPISLEEAKANMRVPFDDQDSLIERLFIPAARQHVEQATNRQFITATLEFGLNRFPYGAKSIELPRAPLQSVSSITYVDGTGTRQSLDSDSYVVNSSAEPGCVSAVFGSSWPFVRDRVEPGSVLITFVAGYGDHGSDVPAPLRQAMLLMIGHLYYHREAVVLGATPKVLPLAVQDLIEPFCYGDEFIDFSGGW